VAEALHPGGVLANVVGCPPASEVVAAHRQFADEFGEVAAGLGAEASDGGVGDAFQSV
jgi:hypothetical protein